MTDNLADIEEAEQAETPAAEEVTTPEGVTVKLGDKVIYTNSDGREQVGWVCATPTTQGYTASEAGTVHIYTVSAHSGPYVSTNIAPGEGPKTFRLAQGD